MAKQLAFYFDASKCTFCKTCQVACQSRHNLPVEVAWRRVYQYGGGSWAKHPQYPEIDLPVGIFAYSLSISCNHCQNPKCLSVCPTSAITKREEDGIVLINTDRCIGCKYCAWACPYGAPQFNEKEGIMSKCDFCQDLLAEGIPPVCVSTCNGRALDFGDIEELQAKYGSVDAIAPSPPGDITNPSLVITPHGYAKPVGDTSGRILNLPEEI